MAELLKSGVECLSRMMKAREISAEELARVSLEKIEENEHRIGAFLRVEGERALAFAREIDHRRAAGEEMSPLAGIPMALKDNIMTKGIVTTCASRMLADFVPPYDAYVTERLRDAGAVLMGKLNMDEFAMGSATRSSAMHPTHNPLDVTRVPGGSSGGSAAAVAAGEVVFSLGSDTGGSIRQPAAFCGVVGIKPTYGSVSRYGVAALANSLDQVGPLTATVRDNAAVLAAIAGKDCHDATSKAPEWGEFSSEIGKGVRGLRLALPRELFAEGLTPDVRAAVQSAIDTLCALGAEVEEVTMPSLSDALAAYHILAAAEASSNLARFDGVRYGYRADAASVEELYVKSRSEGLGPEVKRRILLGSLMLSAEYSDYYRRAQAARLRMSAEFARVFARFDAILSPTTPTVACHADERQEPLAQYRSDIYTVSAAIAGIPAMSMPCGLGEGGMPVGLQLMGKAFSEATLYRIAAALEDERGCLA